MKISLLLAFILTLQVSATIYSQNTRFTLDTKEMTVKQLLKSIEDQSEFRFFYNDEFLKLDSQVDMEVADMRVEEILDNLITDTDVTYKVLENNLIVFTPKSNLQQFKVTGIVKDANTNDPLAGVYVLIQGSNSGAITDIDGKYTIEVPSQSAVLVFSYVGYTTEAVAIAGKSVIDVQLMPDIKALEEIVVVGYGKQRKVDLTGSISSVSAEDISSQLVTGLDQALQARAAGVQVTQNSGAPGGSVSVRVRGVGSISSTSEPLYIIDGLPFQPYGLVSLNPLNAINPNDIESIQVLKDAGSAAIYGARASNGVILITTKRGKTGKAKVQFDMYYGIQSASKKLDLLNGPEYAELANEATANYNADPANSPVSPNPNWANPASLSSTDWQDEVFRTAPIQNYNLTVSGGTERMKSAVSANYMNQEGILINSNYQRFAIRLNNDFEVNEKLKFGNNLSVTNEQSKPNDDGVVIEQTLAFFPMQPVYAEDGLQSPTVYGVDGYALIPNSVDGLYYPIFAINPVWRSYEAIKRHQTSMRVLGTFFGEYTIIPGLNFRSSIGVDYADALGTSYQKRVPENVRGNLSIGTYAEEGSNVLTWNFVNTLTFSKTIAQKHSFSILAGSDLLKTYVSNISGYANNFLNDEIYMISNGAERVAEGSKVEYGLMSYIGRLTYAYDDRYLFAFNVRSDASANFAPDKRRGTFPSASAGWRISEEAFMSPLTFISNLKLRASWGILGNQNIPPFQYLSTYSTANTTYTLGTGTQAGQTAAFPVNLGNPDIQWERVEQKDIGMDVDLMAGRLSLVLDYYIKDNNDMLITEPRPSYFPITTVTTNGASMRNQGFEFTVAYRKQSGSFQWDANVNLTTLKNEVTGLGDLGLPIIRDLTGGVTYNNAATRTEIGQPIGYFWGLQTDGLFQNDAEVAAANGSHGSVKPGDRRYVDQNGDGKIDDKDRINLGDGLPNLLLGAGFNASYKNFDFSLLLSGQFGSQIANANRRRLYDLVQQQGAGLVNVSSDMKNHWKGEGTSTTIPRVTLDTPSNNILFSDFYIEDGDFVRLRNIQLGYTIPNIPFLEKLRIYISAQNLLTFTSYTGFDPEIGSRNQDQLVTGYDNTRYPSAKSIMGGINLQF